MPNQNFSILSLEILYEKYLPSIIWTKTKKFDFALLVYYNVGIFVFLLPIQNNIACYKLKMRY